MSTADIRCAQLDTIARAYVTEALAKKNFDVLPSDDNVTLRAPLCPEGLEVPLTGKENLRHVWWAPLPPRSVTFSVTAKPVTIQRARLPGGKLPLVPGSGVDAQEPSPPQGEEPMEGLLPTRVYR